MKLTPAWRRFFASTPVILVLECLGALVFILVLIRPHPVNWTRLTEICIAWGIVVTIAGKAYAWKYARTLGLSHTRQLFALKESVKTTTLPADKEALHALPAYLQRNLKILEKQKKSSKFNIIFIGVMFLLSLITREIFGIVIFGFFTALSVYINYGPKNSEKRMLALQEKLKKHGIDSSSESKLGEQQWSQSVSYVKNAGWIIGTVLFMLLIVLVLNHSK